VGDIVFLGLSARLGGQLDVAVLPVPRHLVDVRRGEENGAGAGSYSKPGEITVSELSCSHMGGRVGQNFYEISQNAFV
jgi:hypothetical protein